MNVALRNILRNLGQDQVVEGVESSIDALVVVCLSGVSKVDAIGALKSLDDLLKLNFTQNQWAEWWVAAPAEIIFHRSDDIELFIRKLRQVLSQRLVDGVGIQ
jgi:hypothetical protein